MSGVGSATVDGEENLYNTHDGEGAANVEIHSNAEEEDEEEVTGHKNKRKLRSDVWTHFIVVKKLSKGVKVCKCKYCGLVYNKITSRTGTGNMRRHLEVCPRKSTRDVGKALMARSVAQKFDPNYFRELLCSAVIVHDLPFRFVEYNCIRLAFEYLLPEVNLVSRNTLKSDVLKMYEKEKGKIKCMLEMAPGRICLTSDCWSSITTDGYISLTCHFIDENWVLQKRVLNFSLMPSPHTGVALSNKLLSMFSEWGIENKIFSLTLDNASSNDVSVDLLVTQLQLNDALLCKGEYYHIRCCAHVINLVVQDGLKDIDGAVTKICDSIKYVRGSQMMKQRFVECVAMVSLSNKKGLRQDVPTRWNSTFLMLDSALYYKKAFMNMQLSDPNYIHAPTPIEWEKIEKIRSFLSLFYEVTNMFSGSKYPTTNLYFRPIVTCYASLIQSKKSEDEYIRKMAEKMLLKFEKYWSTLSLILTIAVVFDPRYKLQFVDFSYKKLYGADSKQYSQVQVKLFSLFDEYCKTCEKKAIECPKSSEVESNVVFESEMSAAMVEEFCTFDTEFGLSQQKSQLSLYLEEPQMDVKANLDILEYWKGNQYRYPHVACMARDILSIPITTVASESVFSVGGRVRSISKCT